MLRFGASRSIRRSATVTISHPEASRAAFISSALRYLPVPSIRREVKILPPISRTSNIELPSFLDELLRFLAHGVADLLGDLHRAEVRTAHRAEVRRLRPLGRERGIVELLRGLRIESEVELVLPAELEARLRHGVVPGPR